MRLGLVVTLMVGMAGMGHATEHPPAPEPEELRAVVVECEGDTVEVWIALPASVDAGSVEVQLAGRLVAIRARDDRGRTVRSAPLQLRESVVEDGAEARTEGTWLIVALRKQLLPSF
jgi:hypothetical protein